MRPFHINSIGEVTIGEEYAGHVDDLLAGNGLDREERNVAIRWREAASRITTSLYRVYAWLNLSAPDIPNEGVFFEVEYELGYEAVLERKRWTPQGERPGAVNKRHIQGLVDQLVRQIARLGYDVFVETDASIGFRWSIFVKIGGADDVSKVGGLMEHFRLTTELDKYIVSVM